MGRSCGRTAVFLVLTLLLVGCGSASAVRGSATTLAAHPPSTVSPVLATTGSPVPTTTGPTTTVALSDPSLAQVGGAGQAVVVIAPRYGATTATLTAYERDGDGWRRALGPWPARVGARGLAPPGEKREGDGRTPSGVYGFDFFFGVAADPGVRFPYRRVTGPSIVWDDDPASPLYNTWVDLDRQRAGADPERMHTTPAYDHGAVIAYNTARTPGLGSAIFLHVSTGAPTAGCVSLPAAQLVEVLRWLNPDREPRIVLGVG